MSRYADTVLTNANVITMDQRQPRAQAIAVQGAAIIAVSATDDLRDLIGPDTVTIDLGGRTVTPGLIDGHAHLDREGLKYLYPSLAGARSVADVLELVKQAAADRPPGEWVVTMPIGTPPWYFDGPETLAERRGPTRHELDAAVADHPVYIRGPWGYWNKPPLWSFANSMALQKAGIDRDTRPPSSTVEIERDPETGEPTGAFRETYPVPILELTLFRAVPRFTHQDRVRALEYSMALYASTGTTSVYEGHGVAPEVIRAYHQLWESGQQTVRAALVLSPTWSTVDEAERTLADWLPYAAGRGFGDDRLRIGGVFVPFGGHPEVAQAARAALPYTAWAGFVNQAYTPAEFREYARVVLAHGHRLNTTVGEDLDAVLDVIEPLAAEIPLADRQLVLQHLRIVSPAAIERMKRLRAVVTTQPASYIWKAGPEALARADNGEQIVPHRALLDAGLPFVLSTDNKPYQPLVAVWAALARTARETGQVIGPGQTITREEALRAMTLDAARITFEEDRKGSIEVGKLADLVVFAQDPLTVPLDQLPDLPVELTMIGSQIVHYTAALA